jgi:hypothetical protein
VNLPASFKNLELRQGASASEIRRVEVELGQTFPIDYTEFLRTTDGVEGFVGPESYLKLWSVARIPESNAGYDVRDFFAGAVLLGTDGGGTGYGFITVRPESPQYFAVPMVGLSADEATLLGGTLDEAMNKIAVRAFRI